MELFNYLLKVSACSALFFAFYLLVLRKLTFFKINRFYLLFSVVISFIIPALQFTIEREVEQRIEITQSIALQDVDILTPIVVGTGQVDYEAIPFNWFTLLPYLYGGIVTCLLTLAAWRLFQLLKHIKAPVKKINRLKLVVKRSGFTNCSFFNYVFIDENSLTETELTVLLKHEEVHARQYHSVDKLILMIAKAVLWFNPIIYLYDKALEQTHEYEADEATSQNVGTKSYATLLLKLTVSKSSNPFIHNFVKSPIKQRIKMLFNSKSKNMKKLAYLLALPIGLGLIWGFTVKITHRVKPLVQQETPQLQDTLPGKTVKGKVISFEKSKMGEVLNLKVGNTIIPINCYNFKDKVKIGDEISVSIGGKSFSPPPPIGTDTAKWNKKYNDHKTSYLVSRVMGANGKTIYELPHYAFLYEANRARFAWSTIKSIEKNANGLINKIILYDKHGFTINLNVAAQHFKSNNFKKGDSIVVKFIGEKLTGVKTYTTDKMIALYSRPKKYELINKALYPKFYHENGKQKVYDKLGKPILDRDSTAAYTAPINTYSRPILLTSSAVKVNNKTKIIYIQDAKMKLFNGELEAKEVEMGETTHIITAKGGFTFTDASKKVNYVADDSTIVSNINQTVKLYGNAQVNFDKSILKGKMIEVNNKTRMITAHDAVFAGEDGHRVSARLITYDIDKNQYTASQASGNIKIK